MPLPADRHPFFISLLVAVSIAFFVLLVGFWEAIFWSVIFGILFQPVQLRIASWLKARYSLAAVLTVILIFFTVLVPAMWVASVVAKEGVGLYSRIESGELDLGAVVRWLHSLVPQFSDWIAQFGINLEDLSQKLSTTAVAGSRFVASLALNVGQNVASFVVMFFLMLYLLFFTLRDGGAIVRQLQHAIPLPDEQKRDLFDKFAEVSRATIKGTLVIGLVQGFLGGLIFLILGIKSAVFWGVMMVILSVLPAVGSGLVWGPAAVYLFVTGDWSKGLILLTYGILVIGLVDNLLRPLLVGRDTKLPDYLVLFSTIGGLGLFGITGFVLGPIIAALFLAVWQIYGEAHSGADA